MRVRFAVGLLIVLVVVTSAPAQTVKGDAKPWEEVQAAYARLAKMKSYRMKTSLSEEGLTRTGAGPQAPAPPGSAGSPPSGMRTVTFLTEGVNPDRFYTIVQIGDFTAELIQVGTEARTLITRKGEADLLGFLFSALMRARTAEDLGKWRCSPAQVGDMTTDYYDYDAPITIELPKCG